MKTGNQAIPMDMVRAFQNHIVLLLGRVERNLLAEHMKSASAGRRHEADLYTGAHIAVECLRDLVNEINLPTEATSEAHDGSRD